MGLHTTDPHMISSHIQAEQSHPHGPGPETPAIAGFATTTTITTTTYLVDEGVGTLWTKQQDGAAQRVPVAVQLLCLHGSEEAAEHVADILVHLLQGHIKAQP